MKEKQRSTIRVNIRGIDENLYKRFVASVVANMGQRRGKHSYVAAEFNRLMANYLDSGRSLSTQHTRKQKREIMKENLKQKASAQNGFLSDRDIMVACNDAGLIDSRIIQYELYILQAKGFFKNLGLRIKKIPCPVKMEITEITKPMISQETKELAELLRKEKERNIEVV
jgi:hypothetical protein